MDLNITLIFEMIVFALFVLVTMRFIWPPIIKAIEERKKKIADGLEAAEQGTRKLALAKQKSEEVAQAAKQEATKIVDDSNARAAKIIEDAKAKGTEENKRIVENAKVEVLHQVSNARESLCKELADMVVAGAEKIVKKDIDKSAHNKMLDELINELEKSV